jgi:pimeloyl-ACP methyl ester carboxylesterase
MTATVNGVRLSYSDIGQGIPLICLHGGMGVDARSLHVPGILDLAQLASVDTQNRQLIDTSKPAIN